MKGKEISTHLSLVAFFQVLFLAFGGTLVNEFLKKFWDRGLLLLLLIVTMTSIGMVIYIYFKVFNKIRRKK